MKKFLTSIIVVVMLLSIVCGCVACSKETSFDKVVKCAKTLQEVMTKEFDSFEICEDCGYTRGYDDYPFTVYIYIPFSVEFEGETYYDVAYFVSGDFIGFESDYDDGSYEKDLDLDDQIQFLLSSLIYVRNDAKEKFSKEDVTKALSPESEVDAQN